MIVFMSSIHFSIFQVIKKQQIDKNRISFYILEIYLIACLIDYFSTVAIYVEYV